MKNNNEEIKNCYQILGINLGLLRTLYEENPIEKVIRTTDSRDRLIRDSYKKIMEKLEHDFQSSLNDLLERQNKEMEIIEYGLNSNNTQRKIEEINDEKERKKIEHEDQLKILKENYEKDKKIYTNAYSQIATEEARRIYDRKMNFNSERPFLDGDSAYDFYALSESEIYSLKDSEADTLIKNIFNQTIKKYKLNLNDSNLDSDKKAEIENDLELAHKYYDKISNPEKRKQYKEELDLNEKKIKSEIIDSKIKEACSKVDQFDPELIKTVLDENQNKIKALKYKKAIDPITLILPDNKDRDVWLTKSGEIRFINSTNGIESYISEYVVSRNIDGEIKEDTIYTNLSLPQLALDEKTEKPIDPDYYDCVVNKLLSEVVIRGAKYNKGYVGLVEKDENNDYQITIKNKELDDTEKENLAAVMIYNEQQNGIGIENKTERDER